MEPNYHPDIPANYNYKFDQNAYMCAHVAKKLAQIFQWDFIQHYVSQEKVAGLKNMKNFDFKQCAEYTNIPLQVKTISQTHNGAMCYSPHAAFYHLNFKDGDLKLTYEFD